MKSKMTPFLLAVIVPLFAIVGTMFMVYLKRQENTALSTSSSDFPYEQYIENPKNLNGNTYDLRGEILMQLADLSEGGRVITLRCSDGVSELAVYIPENLGENITPSQRYIMRVKIAKKGQIFVESMKKI